MKKTVVLLFALISGLFLAGCESTEKAISEPEAAPEVMESVKGMLAYRERIALPPDAVVTITLEDVSRMDTKAVKLAEQTFTTDGTQVPFDFELSYNASDIQENHRYNVRARIEINGQLRFITDTANPVLTDEKKTKEVNLMLKGTR